MRFQAIVFDFDGVLVESADVKTQAFAQLYSACGEAIARRVVDYHLAHAGISRYVKFRVWQEEFLGVPYTEADGERLSAEFSRLVVDRIVAAPYVRGAIEFLEAHHRLVPLYVASGTPTDELREIVQRRGMGRYFVGIYGTPDTKSAILKSIVRANRYNPGAVVMIGDAMADLEGAKEAGVGFVGVETKESSVFPPGTSVIGDLSHLERALQVAADLCGRGWRPHQGAL